MKNGKHLAVFIPHKTKPKVSIKIVPADKDGLGKKTKFTISCEAKDFDDAINQISEFAKSLLIVLPRERSKKKKLNIKVRKKREKSYFELQRDKHMEEYDRKHKTSTGICLCGPTVFDS